MNILQVLGIVPSSEVKCFILQNILPTHLLDIRYKGKRWEKKKTSLMFCALGYSKKKKKTERKVKLMHVIYNSKVCQIRINTALKPIFIFVFRFHGKWCLETAVAHHLPGSDPGSELSRIQPRHAVFGYRLPVPPRAPQEMINLLVFGKRTDLLRCAHICYFVRHFPNHHISLSFTVQT